MTSDSSYVLSKLIPLPSHVWSITSDVFLGDDMYTLVLFLSIISSLILILDSVSVYFWKVMSVLNEISV